MADIGYGTKLQLEDTSTGGPVLTAIAGIHDLSGPELDRDDVEITDYDSTDRYREYIPGLREGGEITATLNLLSTDAQQQGLFHSTAVQTSAGTTSSTGAVAGAFDSNSNRNWRISGPNDDFWKFTGYVKGIAQSQPIDDRRTWDVTWKITSRPTYGHTS